MAIAGVVKVDLPGTNAVGMAVSGAPTGALDLEIVTATLTACGAAKNESGAYTISASSGSSSGAPDAAEMAR